MGLDKNENGHGVLRVNRQHAMELCIMSGDLID